MTQTLAAPSAAVPVRTSSLLRTIIATNIGAVFEWYDLVLYAMFVVVFSKQFFVTADPSVGVILSLSTFASAWLVRPLGAIVIGNYADKAGRKPALILSAGLMMLGTLMTAILPNYASIGIAAPILLVCARLLQGFSAGGEFGSATAMLVEQDPTRRGFYAATQWASSGFAVFMASMFAFLINTSLTPDQVASWGWRIPFLFGLLIGPVAWYIRQRVDESAEFEHTEQAATPLVEVVTEDKLRILVGAGLVAAGAAGSFMNTYMPTFATTKLGLDPSVSLIGTIVAGLINSTIPFIFGALSDRTGRVPLMTGFAILALFATYPMFLWLVASPSVFTLIAIQAMLAFVLYSGYYAVVPSALSELYQTRRRVTGISISYVLGQLLFGGVTPLVVGAIVGQTGNPTHAGLYLTAIIAISIVSIWGCRRLGVR